jgi:hypothetical protein
MRASLPPRRHRDHHRNKHNSSSQPQPMGPQHPDNNADQRATSSTTGKLHTTSDGLQNTTPSRRLRRQDAVVARPEGRGFHPGPPAARAQCLAMMRQYPIWRIERLQSECRSGRVISLWRGNRKTRGIRPPRRTPNPTKRNAH